MNRTSGGCSAAIAIAALALAAAGCALAVWAHAGGTADRLSGVALAATITLVALTGCVLSLARPDNRVGWLMLAAASAWGVGEGCFDAGVRGILSDESAIAGAGGVVVVGAALRAAGWLGTAVAVPLVFPDGRLPAGRWRWLGWCAVAALTADLLGTTFAPDVENLALRAAGWHNPLPVPAAAGQLGDLLASLSLPLLAVTVAGGVAALITRWRRGGAPIRRQLLVLAAAAALPVVVIPTAFGAGWPPWVFAAAVVPLPVAVTVAILTGGLFDLATVANRSLVWGTLSATIVAIYALVVAGTGAIFGDREARWLPWLAAGVVATSFGPLRDALQRAANRITYGRWRQPYEVLAGLGPRIEAAADADRVLADVVTELHATLGLAGVALRDPAGRVIAGAAGTAPVVVPLTAYGTPAGALLYSAPATPLRTADHRLLDDLAAQLAVLMHARALTGDLRRARERLVLAREEERRRLRRDLHDGLGPALAGMLLKVENARALVPTDPADAGRDLLVLQGDIRDTVLDVRRLVEGLRPPALDELGLAAALTEAVTRLASRTGTAVEVTVAYPLPPVPAALEVALYRITCEAVANAVRHSGAGCCRVTLRVEENAVVAVIADDGVGVAPARQPAGGHGLATMRERAEELGGVLEIRASGAGTTVLARLPLPPAGTDGGGS